MRKADVQVGNVSAGTLEELSPQKKYRFIYHDGYVGLSVSLTMPTTQKIYDFNGFPPFFDGLLPEGMMLDALIRNTKIDRFDLFGQLISVGADLVGNIQVRELT